MALLDFANKIVSGRPIDVFNYGKHRRDFTYIDDIVEGIIRVLDRVPKGNENWDGKNPDPSSSYAPYRFYNVGNNKPVELIHYIELLEKYLGMEAKKNMLPIQPGDHTRNLCRCNRFGTRYWL